MADAATSGGGGAPVDSANAKPSKENPIISSILPGAGRPGARYAYSRVREHALSESVTSATGGVLAEGVALHILRQVYLQKQTGLLHFRQGDKSGSIFLIGGEIAWGTTNLLECRLGACLARHGRVTQWQLDQASALVDVTGRRLGQVLQDMGILDAQGLREALALQVQEMMAAVCNWNDGQWQFEPHRSEDFRGFNEPIGLPMAHLIMEMVWSIEAPDSVRRGLGDTDRVLRLSQHERPNAQQLDLTPEDGFLLSRIDGTLRAREILEISGFDLQEGERRLLGLICTGIVEYAPKVEPAKKVVRRAETPPPSVKAPTPQPTPKAAVPKPSAPKAAVPPAPAASNPVEPSEPAHVITQEERLGQLAAALKDPARHKEIERELREILAADPACAEAYYQLGVISKSGGATKRAQALFRKAVDLNPKHRAASEIDAAEPPAKTEEPGFLRRFLRS